MKIIAGLGNPDVKYKNTFHNLGFMCVDKTAEKLGVYFNDGVTVQSNSGKSLNLNPSKDEIISELENFCFFNWQQKYDENDKPILENAWSIELKLDGENLKFIGLDDYPKIWPYVEWFVSKYGGFDEIKE